MVAKNFSSHCSSTLTFIIITSDDNFSVKGFIKQNYTGMIKFSIQTILKKHESY